jgi:aldehyde dehydrogenase (NAD+)/betaine-aldehyde dehydrogenase
MFQHSGSSENINAPLKLRTDLLINGKSVPGLGSALTVINPATEEPVVTFAGSALDQVDLAVGAARAAFNNEGAWSNPQVRRAALHTLASLMLENSDALMGLLVEEIGTPISLKPAQFDAPVSVLRWFADAAMQERSRELPSLAAGKAAGIVAHRPVGVVAAIAAYNYPLMLAVTKIGAALAAGCTAVLLPSPQGQLAILMLADLIERAGFPPGVINILAGGADVGRALSAHPGVDKTTFTGSVQVGRLVMQQAATGPRDIVLELGGKSAAILLPGVVFEDHVQALHARYARNAGQGCAAPTRILVERSRLDEFITLSRAAYEKLVVGDPRDRRTVVGPLISSAHRDRVESYVAEAVAGGAKIAAGGGRPAQQRGWFMNPTLVAEVDNRARIAREELFGPVAVLLPYSDLDEAIAIANDSEFGLKAYLYGDAALSRSLAPRLRVGTVEVNGGSGFRPDAPMCGYGQSGIGCEWGEEGILEFMKTQYIDSPAH